MTMLTSGRVVLAVCLALLYSGSISYVSAQAVAANTRDTSEISLSVKPSSSSPAVPVDLGETPAASVTGGLRVPSEMSLPPVGRTSSSLDVRTDSAGTAAASGIGIMAVSPTAKRETGIDWWYLAEGSLAFLTVEHTFRYATEWGTRDAFDTPFWPGYLASAGNLHGWADGDPFLVNYVGHPMQGAVAGFIWQHSDRAYRDVVFGENRRYWKAKLRGAAFSYLYSVQFEIGLISEASIGHVQAQFPQQGFVDHVITPTVGLGWTLAEDSLDRYVITLFEEHDRNPYLRLLLRSGLNPSRSMANAMNGMVPWHRDNRPGVFKPFPEAAVAKAALERETAETPVNPPLGVAPFEFTVTPNFRTYFGSGAKGSCVGGGSSIAFRVASDLQIVADVNGCKLLDLPTNLSGDSLSYMIGPRWTPAAAGRWNAHAQFLVGGAKLTQEKIYPDEKLALFGPAGPKAGNLYATHPMYTKDWETNGFAVAAATGVDYKINNALALRVASLEYSHSWTQDLNGFNYQNGLQLTTGLVLRMGTW
ncbi:MAG: hypothetical protein WBM04_07380 [Candidatus Korobacteraceae bacterium]